MQEKLSQLLSTPVKEVQKLFGEASYRVYYRLFTKSGKTFVLMEMAKGKKMSASEEITNLKEKPAELPFINIQRYLQSLKLPVPEVKFFSAEEGWIVLEDLGDTKLENVVQNADPKETVAWYKKAIDLLVLLQTKATPDKKCIAFERSFDATLFNWEFDHFWQYYGEVKSLKFKVKSKGIFQEVTRKITEELCKLPQGFTHRDYQSRNLMVHNNQLMIIDFQDALLGPKAYDLVALLRDSYIDVTPHLETLLNYYCEKSGEDFKKFKRLFDLQTVQRKMKDAGRFVYIDRVKKNPNFLKHIPTSLSYVRQALERLPEHKKLVEFL